VSKTDCAQDLFYGTDYHSHLGTCRGGLAVKDAGVFTRGIHDITNAQFRAKFENDIAKMRGNIGVGVISDNESQPLLVGSHLGQYAIVTVGLISNIEALAAKAFERKTTHFSEMSGGGINPTELIATLINQEATFEDGIRHAQNAIEGSCSMLLLTDDGLYAARDRLGRTPLIVGVKDGATAVASESTAFPNLGYETQRDLGPGEIALITAEGAEQRRAPGDAMQICAFLWIYYGYPSSDYEGLNVEQARNRCGAALARRDDASPDMVAGIPDSGTGHAIGYANEAHIAYGRPFVKYTPTWPRSFMPQSQEVRDLVAKMKLVPIKSMIRGRKILFCEDSIVRGTQLKDTILEFFSFGAQEVHMRPACPPLIFKCKYLNFSRSRSELDLAARQAIKEIEGASGADLEEYARPDSAKHHAMVDRIRQRLSLSTLRYQQMDDMVQAIGLPKERLCTYCWDGCEGPCGVKQAAAATL
jgi:amidophosphoribosyltransferase